MDSDDEITVAQPNRMSVGFLHSSTENDSDLIDKSEKVAAAGEMAPFPAAKRDPSVEDSPSSADTTSNPANLSRDSTPLSDVDEEVLEKVPTSVLEQVASDDGLFASRFASAATSDKSVVVSSSSTSNFSSSPQAPSANQTSRRRRGISGTGSGAMLPPPKRQQRGRPRKAALWDSSLSRTQLDGPAADLALDDTEDDLEVRPTANQTLGRGSTRTSRVAARARRGPLNDSEDEYASKLRNRDEEKERYEPLCLYEDSNWVLFDAIKSFPREFPTPPRFMQDYTHYQPGNERVLEYNLVSNSVRIKSTPKVLQGKMVRYEQNGPKLV